MPSEMDVPVEIARSALVNKLKTIVQGVEVTHDVNGAAVERLWR